MILLERLSARDGDGLARSLGRHIDTIVEVEEASDRARASRAGGVAPTIE